MSTKGNSLFIKENWGQMPLNEICGFLSLSLYELLEFAFELELYKVNTPELKRRWTEDEDNFMKDYSSKLNTQEACNLLYRSRYATYQRAKFLNLYQMIGK